MTPLVTTQHLLKALRDYYGYENFRAGQQEIISTLLGGQELLAVLPTGAGKSLCFQLPALFLPGLALVVSPLISLMKDQTEQLARRGLQAAYLASDQTPGQQREILRQALSGELKFFYLAPERLTNRDFLRVARQLPISLVAIDEAHCVSQWGRSFRRDYYRIPEFLAALEQRPRLAAFTATATPRVRQDIIRHLKMTSARIIVRGFDRPNLFFAVARTRAKERALLEFLRLRPQQCGIIYCATRSAVETTTRLLRRQNFPALRYHAGLTSEERQRNQQLFVSGKLPLIVATNAFGMGIDKADVRFVVHFEMPLDLEAYYQEAGRAGRDGRPATCLLLYSPLDTELNRSLIALSGAAPAEQQLELALLKEMEKYCLTKECLRRYLLRYFGDELSADCGYCSNCRARKKSREF